LAPLLPSANQTTTNKSDKKNKGRIGAAGTDSSFFSSHVPSPGGILPRIEVKIREPAVSTGKIVDLHTANGHALRSFSL
jgi:hypothetical protein